MWLKTLIFCITAVLLKCCMAANILFVIPHGVKSHYIVQRAVGLELAHRGHNVTVISAFKEKSHPQNYRQIVVDRLRFWEIAGEKRPNLFTLSEYSSLEFIQKITRKGGLIVTEYVLKSKEVQTFLAQNQTFDLVISEHYVQEATNMLAHKYKAPLVLLSTFPNANIQKFLMGNPLQLATVPHEFLITEQPTAFFERLKNLYVTFYDYIWWKYCYLGKQESLAKKYIPDLPQPIPSLYDLQKNAALFLINNHFSFQSPVSLLPNVIEIAGIHLSETEDLLPNDLKKLLDEAKDGVIYVSFGTNIHSADWDHHKKTALIKVFSNLNHTVLWKWDEEIFENKPSNIIVRQWFPQKEILAHHNVKLFFCHGGLTGALEAVFYGVPIIGIPIYGDQYRNLQSIEEAGVGRRLALADVTEEKLRVVLDEFLKDNTYVTRAKEQARIFKDRPMKTLDLAMFWIEYVIRNKHANPLKNPKTKVNWIAYSMLDVYAFILFVAFLIVFGVYKLGMSVYFVISKCRSLPKLKNKLKEN